MALQFPGDQQSTEWISLFWTVAGAPGKFTSRAFCHTPRTSLATKLWPLLCVSSKLPTAAQLPEVAQDMELMVSEGSASAPAGGINRNGFRQTPLTSLSTSPSTLPEPVRYEPPALQFPAEGHESAGRNPLGSPVAPDGRLTTFAACHWGA